MLNYEHNHWNNNLLHTQSQFSWSHTLNSQTNLHQFYSSYQTNSAPSYLYEIKDKVDPTPNTYSFCLILYSYRPNQIHDSIWKPYATIEYVFLGFIIVISRFVNSFPFIISHTKTEQLKLAKTTIDETETKLSPRCEFYTNTLSSL